MKSAWIDIGFSHHKVPSLSKTATRSPAGTPSDTVRSTNSTTARLAAPSFQLASALSLITRPLSVRQTLPRELEAVECQIRLSAGRHQPRVTRTGRTAAWSPVPAAGWRGFPLGESGWRVVTG